MKQLAKPHIDNKQPSFLKVFCFAFIPFAIGFIASCFFRSVNAVLLPTLEESHHLTTSQIGFVCSTYFIAFAAFQIPLGILLDRYGPRKIKAILMLLTSAGLVWYGIGSNVWQLALAHALIGIGLSGSLMAALKIIVQWFEPKQIPMLNGIMMMSGGLGILLAATPAEYLAEYYHWQHVNFIFAGITFLIAVMIYVLVPESKKHLEISSIKNHIDGLFSIYRDKFFWSTTPIIFVSLGSFLAIQGLWIENVLHDVNRYAQSTINTHLSLLSIAMTISLFSTGYIAKLAKRYGLSLHKILLLITLIYILIESLLALNLAINSLVLWFCYGFFSQLYNLCYLILAEHYPKTHSARANAALNILTFSTVFLLQYLIGVLLSHWQTYDNHFPISAYQNMWALLIMLQIFTVFWTYAFHKGIFRTWRLEKAAS